MREIIEEYGDILLGTTGVVGVLGVIAAVFSIIAKAIDGYLMWFC